MRSARRPLRRCPWRRSRRARAARPRRASARAARAARRPTPARPTQTPALQVAAEGIMLFTHDSLRHQDTEEQEERAAHAWPPMTQARTLRGFWCVVLEHPDLPPFSHSGEGSGAGDGIHVLFGSEHCAQAPSHCCPYISRNCCLPSKGSHRVLSPQGAAPSLVQRRRGARRQARRRCARRTCS